MRRKVLVTVTAMMLAAQLGSPLSAEPTTEQLGAIAGYLEENDVQGLRDYLALHPELAEGDTPLAALLRRFLVESAGGRFFQFEPNLSDTVDDLRDEDRPARDAPAEPPDDTPAEPPDDTPAEPPDDTPAEPPDSAY
jgi:hypothetical protein